MKKIFILKLTIFVFTLMTFVTSCAQNDTLNIKMTVDYDEWKKGSSNWDNAITFSDNSSEDDSRQLVQRRGRNFRSNVKPGQNLTWESDLKNGDKEKIILVNVVRYPANGGAYLLTEFWYNAQDNGAIILGQVKEKGFAKGLEERYIISFTVSKGDGTFDTYTVDPIIRGSDK
jgi:hypothetical protein